VDSNHKRHGPPYQTSQDPELWNKIYPI